MEVKPAEAGGQSGIRTHGTLTRTPVFKTGSLNRSDICPKVYLSILALKVKEYFYLYLKTSKVTIVIKVSERYNFLYEMENL